MHLPFPVLTAEDAAAMINDGQTVGFSAFTPAGSAKSIPRAIAERAIGRTLPGGGYLVASEPPAPGQPLTNTGHDMPLLVV